MYSYERRQVLYKYPGHRARLDNRCICGAVLYEDFRGSDDLNEAHRIHYMVAKAHDATLSRLRILPPTPSGLERRLAAWRDTKGVL